MIYKKILSISFYIGKIINKNCNEIKIKKYN